MVAEHVELNEAGEKVYADGLYSQEAVSFENGVLALNNVTSGDKVSFTITVENNSTVSVKYRTKITSIEDDGLMLGLVFNMGDEDYSGLISYVSTWETWSETGTKTVDATIELPYEAGNEYQGLSCKIAYVVEAVQGNGATDDSESGLKKVYFIHDADTLKTMLASGEHIILTDDINVEKTSTNSQPTIEIGDGAYLDLGGHTLRFDNANGKGIELSLKGANKNNTKSAIIENGKIEVAKIAIGAYAPIKATYSTLTLRNVTIEADPTDDNYNTNKTQLKYVISGSEANTNVLIEDCSIYGNIYSASSCSMTITNSTIHGLIKIASTGTVVVNGGILEGDYENASAQYGTEGKFTATNTIIRGSFRFKSNGSAQLIDCPELGNLIVSGGTLYLINSAIPQGIDLCGGSLRLKDITIATEQINFTSGYIYDYDSTDEDGYDHYTKRS